MIAAWMALHFAICPASGALCEEGTTIARDCATAVRFLRAGLRPQQRLVLHRCVPWDSSAWPSE